MLYKIQNNKIFILKPDPLIYGGRKYEIKIDFLKEGIENNPAQIAAVYQLNKMGIWSRHIRNPLGVLIFSVFNEETPDNYDLRESIRNDMEQMAYELYLSNTEATNEYLFAPFNELEPEESVCEKERIAADMLKAKNDDELRDVLIIDLLYHAISFHDDWPPPPY